MRIPRHLAIIMDGNGRWAEKRRLPRIAGHQEGVRIVREVVQECRRLGVGYLTLYAFSSEKWGRPDNEVAALMELLCVYLREQLELMLENHIRLRVIGETARLPQSVRQMLEDTMEQTAGNEGMVLTLALSYGARDEILRTVRCLAERVARGDLEPAGIDEQEFTACLDTAGMPDPDLLIRTSGEMRISNFLLWQVAYAEMVFTPVLWPEFGVEELHRAFNEFTRRERRFGLTGDQIVDQRRRSGEKDH